MAKLFCDKKNFRYKGNGFNNGVHRHSGKNSNSYKLFKTVPIELAEIKDEKGNVINKPEKKDDSKKKVVKKDDSKNKK